ncbi:MAG: MFS transporter TsgA [Pseudomonadota bacterium]
MAQINVNQLRVTLVCFTAYFIMSSSLAPIGIVLSPLAEQLGISTAVAARLFSGLTLGILLGSALAIPWLNRVELRSTFVLVSLMLIAALLSLRLVSSAGAIRLSLGFVGLASGMALAAAASAITAMYSSERRASMLVVTDASFSTAGIVMSFLATQLVGAGWHWSSTYSFVAGVALFMLLLVLLSDFPGSAQVSSKVDAARGIDSREGETGKSSRWPIAVWLAAGALFLYTLGQYSLLWWLPLHLESALDVPRDEAGTVVSRFWTGMFLAQLFAAWMVLRIGVHRLMLAGALGGLLGTIPLLFASELHVLLWLALLWGFANMGLLKMVIAFATLTMSAPPPKLVPTLLFGATSGTAISPLLTSWVVEGFGYAAVLRFGTLCYCVLFVLLCIATWSRKREQVASPRQACSS